MNSSTTVTKGYDIRDRLTDINDISSTSGSPFAAEYIYKKNSNVDSASFWNPNIDLNGSLTSAHRKYIYDYSYDGLNRLADADYKLDGSNPAAFDVSLISYDPAGNIDLLKRNDQTGTLVDDLDYSYGNGNNQLTSVSDAAGSTALSWDAEAGSFDYDENGNLNSMTGNPSITDIVYDHRNLAVHTYLGGDVEQIANYNADGQRILKEIQTSGGSTWSFYVRDGMSTLAVISNGELQYMNILGNDLAGRVVANNGAISANGDKRYYLKDLIGSVRAVVDQTGDTKENRDYGPWGILLDERQYVEGAETTEKFSGKELDEQTGWFHFGQRDLMAILGRWPSPDRFAEKYPSMSPYSYAANDPVRLIDVNGDTLNIDLELFRPVVDEDGNPITDKSKMTTEQEHRYEFQQMWDEYGETLVDLFHTGGKYETTNISFELKERPKRSYLFFSEGKMVLGGLTTFGKQGGDKAWFSRSEDVTEIDFGINQLSIAIYLNPEGGGMRSNTSEHELKHAILIFQDVKKGGLVRDANTQHDIIDDNNSALWKLQKLLKN